MLSGITNLALTVRHIGCCHRR